MQTDEPCTVKRGDLVKVVTILNGGRYNGKKAMCIGVNSARTRFVVQLADWTPGLDAPNGVLYLDPAEVLPWEEA